MYPKPWPTVFQRTQRSTYWPPCSARAAAAVPGAAPGRAGELEGSWGTSALRLQQLHLAGQAANVTGRLPAAWGAPGAFASLQARSLRNAHNFPCGSIMGSRETSDGSYACGKCCQTQDFVVAAPRTGGVGPIGARSDKV